MMLLSLIFACTPDPSSDEHNHSEHADHSELTLSPEAVVAARLKLTPAAIGAMSTELTLPARIALDPRKQAVISAWIEGQVDKILVRAGEDVRKGQRLATVQSPDLGEAVASYRSAKALDDAADARLARLKRLREDGVTSQAQVLDAEASHAAAVGAFEAAEERLRILGVDPTVGDPHAGQHFPSRIPVRSPIHGTVLTAPASVGKRVHPGEALFMVGDLSEVWLLLDIYERDLASVRVGQAVRFTVAAYPDDVFEGTVAQVGNWVEPEGRTLEVRVIVKNEDKRLKPNMFAEAILSSPRSGPSAILLPALAVQELNGKDTIFVQEEPTHFEARDVTIIARTRTQVLVSAGVKEGEIVVTEGAFTLVSELEKGELGEGHAH